MSKDPKGYLFPDPIDPEETECFKVYVPKDALYLAAFWRSYEYFTTWHAWKRDDEHTGADVAALWKVAFDQARSEYVAGGGCLPEFRINPDTCLLEVNCGDDNWQPVYTSDHPEGGSPSPYPPETSEYEADTARCIAAANITAQLKYGTETLANDAAIVGGVAIAIINLLGAFLFFIPGGVIVDIAIAIIDLAVGHVASDFSGDLPDIDWTMVRDNIACFIERDGSVTSSDQSAIETWMEAQYSGNLAWALTKIIMQHVNADGLTQDARMPQNDISIEDCPVCDEWCHEWDLTADDASLVVHPDYPTYGVWNMGTGWQSVVDGSYWYLYLYDNLAFATTITRVELDVHVEHAAGYFIDVGIGPVGHEAHPGLVDGDNTVAWTGSEVTDQLNLSTTTQWFQKYTRLKVCGVGDDPFA